MTTQTLAVKVLPYARTAVKESRPGVFAELSLPARLVLAPAWWVILGPLLPFLVQFAVELSVSLAAPIVLRWFGVMEAMLPHISDFSDDDRSTIRDAIELCKTPRSRMHPAVQMALQSWQMSEDP